MNKRIPADVEQLMWLIAESGDSKAAQEFEGRFPDYRFELMRRMSTVKTLREAKPNSPTAVPAFRNIHPVRNRPRWGMVAAFALGLGVFAFGSYAVTQKLTQKPPPAIISTPDLGVHGGGGGSVPKNQSGFQPTQVDQVGATQPTRDPHRTSQLMPNNSTPPLSPEQEKMLAPYQTPQTLRMDDVELRVVFEMIAQNSGLQLEFMPAPKNVTGLDLSKHVSIDYQRMSGVDMLVKLAKDNGYEAVYRDGNTYQIFPVLQFMDYQGG